MSLEIERKRNKSATQEVVGTTHYVVLENREHQIAQFIIADIAKKKALEYPLSEKEHKIYEQEKDRIDDFIKNNLSSKETGEKILSFFDKTLEKENLLDSKKELSSEAKSTFQEKLLNLDGKIEKAKKKKQERLYKKLTKKRNSLIKNFREKEFREKLTLNSNKDNQETKHMSDDKQKDTNMNSFEKIKVNKKEKYPHQGFDEASKTITPQELSGKLTQKTGKVFWDGRKKTEGELLWDGSNIGNRAEQYTQNVSYKKPIIEDLKKNRLLEELKKIEDAMRAIDDSNNSSRSDEYDNLQKRQKEILTELAGSDTKKENVKDSIDTQEDQPKTAVSYGEAMEYYIEQNDVKDSVSESISEPEKRRNPELEGARLAVQQAKINLDEAEANLKNHQEYNKATLQQAVIDARRDLEKAEINLEKAILERRIEGHKKQLVEGPREVFERTEEQKIAEQKLKEAREAFQNRKSTFSFNNRFASKKAGRGRMTDLAFGSESQKLREKMYTAQEEYDKAFAGEDIQKALRLEGQKVILKKRAIENLEHRISELKKEIMKKETADGNLLEKGVGRLELGFNKFRTWISKPENAKELKRRALFSGGVALALGVPTAGIGALGWAGARFLGSYAGGEAVRALYNARKKDYREELKKDRIARLKELGYKKGLTLKETQALNHTRGASYSETLAGWEQKYTQNIQSQNKWTKRWDRIGRILGGGGVKLYEMSIDIPETPSEIERPVPQTSAVEKGQVLTVEHVEDVPELTPAPVPEQKVMEVFDDGSYQDTKTGEFLTEVEIAERTPAGSNTMMDHRIRTLDSQATEQSSIIKGSHAQPVELKELFKTRGLAVNPETFKATGLKILDNPSANPDIPAGHVFLNPITNETYSWQDFYEKVDMNMVSAKYREMHGILDTAGMSPDSITSDSIVTEKTLSPNSNINTEGLTFTNGVMDTQDSGPSVVNSSTIEIDTHKNINTEGLTFTNEVMDAQDSMSGTINLDNDIIESGSLDAHPNEVSPTLDQMPSPETQGGFETIETGSDNIESHNDIIEDQLEIESTTPSIENEPQDGFETIETRTDSFEVKSENGFVPEEKYMGPEGPQVFSSDFHDDIENTNYNEIVMNDLIDSQYENVKNYFDGVRLVQFTDGTYGLSQTLNISHLNISEQVAREMAQQKLDDMGIRSTLTDFGFKPGEIGEPGEVDFFTPISGDQLVFIQNQIQSYRR